MKTQNRIYIVGGIHGNELFGLKILGKLQPYSGNNLQICVANISAVAKNKRYIESDLNRSFGHQPTETLESTLAKTIVRDIEKFGPDIVIDLHTSVTKVGKVAILAKNFHKLVSIAEKLGMERAVVMPDAINKGSLIGQFPDIGIALEIGRDLRSDKLAEEIADRLRHLLTVDLSDAKHTLHSEVYEVIRRVEKHETKGLRYANFKHNTLLDGYPFLMGESNYADIAGFLAQKVKPN